MGSMSFYTSEEVWEGQQRQEDHHGSRQAASSSSMKQGAERTLSGESTGWPNHHDELFGMAGIVVRDSSWASTSSRGRPSLSIIQEEMSSGASTGRDWMTESSSSGRRAPSRGLFWVSTSSRGRLAGWILLHWVLFKMGIQRDKTDRIIWMSSLGRPAMSRGSS